MSDAPYAYCCSCDYDSTDLSEVGEPCPRCFQTGLQLVTPPPVV